jgi:hypothetical protein
MMCSNKKAAFRRPGQCVKKMHNSSDDIRVFLAVPKIIVEHESRPARGRGKIAAARAADAPDGLHVSLWTGFLYGPEGTIVAPVFMPVIPE